MNPKLPTIRLVLRQLRQEIIKAHGGGDFEYAERLMELYRSFLPISYKIKEDNHE